MDVFWCEAYLKIEKILINTFVGQILLFVTKYTRYFSKDVIPIYPNPSFQLGTGIQVLLDNKGRFLMEISTSLNFKVE